MGVRVQVPLRVPKNKRIKILVMKMLITMKNFITNIFKHKCENESRVIGIYGGEKDNEKPTDVIIKYRCRVCNNIYEVCEAL